MSTKREILQLFRKELQERNADSTFTNKDLYDELMKHGKWLIKREINSGRIYKNTKFFQTLGCQRVIEVPAIDECCPVKTDCKIYRTECKIPDAWLDEDGPIIKNVTSVDNSMSFQATSITSWQNKKIDPYQKKSKTMYTFFSDGYLWFPEHNPHFINVLGFWMDDVSNIGCNKSKDCLRFLDTKFMVPDWLHAEMMAKAAEMLAGVTKRMQEDEQIDKNTTRKS